MNIINIFISFTIFLGAFFIPMRSSSEIDKNFLSQEALDRQTFFSQAAQDEFVVIMSALSHKQGIGYYLEIGAAEAVTNNNSYFLEKNCGWKGVSIELNGAYLNPWVQKRFNPLLIQDATQSDYTEILKAFPNILDYLSLDVDSKYDLVLQKIPFDKYRFKIITIEHDAYRFGDVYKIKERAILNSFGYILLCADVIYPQLGPFEDWWIHPAAFEPELVAQLTALNLNNKSYPEIIRTLKTLLN